MFEEYKQENRTSFVAGKLEDCAGIEELQRDIFPLLITQREQWQNKIHQIIHQELQCSQSEFERISGFSRQTIIKWCNGSVPKSREHFIRIGLAAGYDIEQMNDFLQKYGRYPELYPKTPEDCVCMYVIQKYRGRQAVAKYNELVGRLKRDTGKKVATRVPDDAKAMEEQIGSLASDEELQQFMEENTQVFATAYRKLNIYITKLLEERTEKRLSNTAKMGDEQEWSSSLRQCISAIRNGKWYPTRDKVISIGLHFGLTREQVDRLLEMAGMRPLYAKNVFECVVIFILKEAELRNVLEPEAEDYHMDNICYLAKAVMERCGVPELEGFMAELPDGEDEWASELVETDWL